MLLGLAAATLPVGLESSLKDFDTAHFFSERSLLTEVWKARWRGRDDKSAETENRHRRFSASG